MHKKERKRWGEAYVVDTLFTKFHANGAMLSFLSFLHLDSSYLYSIKSSFRMHYSFVEVIDFWDLSKYWKYILFFHSSSLLLISCSFYKVSNMFCIKDFLTQLPMLTYLNDQWSCRTHLIISCIVLFSCLFCLSWYGDLIEYLLFPSWIY